MLPARPLHVCSYWSRVGHEVHHHIPDADGRAQHIVESDHEAVSALEGLRAAAAQPITVETEDDLGSKIVVAHVPFGVDHFDRIPAEKRPMIATARRMDRRIDPSLHSVSLADARRPDCPLIYVNKGFERLTGYTREEVIGRNCRFLQGENTDRTDIARMRAAISSGHALILDLMNYRKDGSAFWNRVSLRPVLAASGEVTHVIGIQSDITRLVDMERNLEQWARDLAGTAEPVPQ